MKLAYEAYHRSGRAVHDTIEAADTGEATELLRRRGLYVTQIRSDAGGLAAGQEVSAPVRPRKIRRVKQVAVFARQLHVLVSTDTRVVEALSALELQISDREWREVVADIRNKVENGNSLGDATATHPRYFDTISQNLIRAGESTGKLPQMLDRLSLLTQKQVQVHRAVVGAMIYPILLIAVSVVVLALMMLFVLPRFVELFGSLKVPLPPTTEMLVGLSHFMTAYWWVLMLIAITVSAGFRYWLGSVSGKRSMDTLLLRLPYVGRVMRNFATARIARLLGILMDSHMPLLDVLALIRHATPNVRYAELIARTEDLVTRGEMISAAFVESDLISPSVCQMVRSGEQSGQVAALLLNVADLLDEENEVVVRSLASVLEPVILIVLGLLVAFVALSMFIPLFDLTGGPAGVG